MKVASLRIHNFRGIRDLKLTFGDHVNILAGANGAGKSAVLDCAAVLLSRFVGRIYSLHGTGRFFTELDVNNDATETRNGIEVVFRGELIRWTVTKTRRGRKGQSITQLKELRAHAARLRADLTAGEKLQLPIAVYYPVNRAVLDIPLRIRKQHQFDRLAAYDQALSGAPNSFRVFFEWFRAREDLENERRLEQKRYRDAQLKAVRYSLSRFLPGFADLRVRRAPLRMTVRKGRQQLIVNQLSDGEKCMMALVGDLARRMAIANPSMEQPLDAPAVVLVDEADLHLHPGWQRTLTGSLRKTFPNTQFILSTHSPQLINHVDVEHVWLLAQTGRRITASRPIDAYGQTAGRILEDSMNVPERPDEIAEQLKHLFLAIDEGNLDEASRYRDALQSLIGSDPELDRASALIHRKRVVGR